MKVQAFNVKRARGEVSGKSDRRKDELAGGSFYEVRSPLCLGVQTDISITLYVAATVLARKRWALTSQPSQSTRRSHNISKLFIKYRRRVRAVVMPRLAKPKTNPSDLNLQYPT